VFSPVARITAVQTLLYNILDDATAKIVLLFESSLLLCDEALEMTGKHSVESSLLRMARTTDCRHIGTKESRNAPFDAISYS
jgi:hypothetical protein